MGRPPKKKDEELIDTLVEEDVNSDISVPDVTLSKTPLYGSPEWENYVLSQLKPEEFDKGYPKTAGLRRIFPKVIGNFIFNGPTFLSFEDGVAVCLYTIKFVNNRYSDDNQLDKVVEIADVADASAANTDSPYSSYLTAVASSRAEGRALRKALLLSTIVAEEISEHVTEESLQIDEDAEITSAQVSGINNFCKKMDIDVLKFIGMGNYKNINDVNREKAKKMVKVLNEYAQKIKVIPDKIRGYNPDWKND